MKKLIIVLFSLAFLAAAITLGVKQNTQHKDNDFSANPVDLLKTESSPDHFSRAIHPRKFIFPDDNGPHNGFQTEWWYYTGNLSAPDGRRFGYQFTLFRRAMTASSGDKEPPASTWRTRHVFIGHLAVTDVDKDTFYHFERFSREGAGLAGATSKPYRVWLENWVVREETDAVRITAVENGLSLELILSPEKPHVLNGKDGLSQKGPGVGNASYYFSQTRLATTGKITVNDDNFSVKGFSWLDREWSTSALGPEQTGWDWFALQLNDGRDIMLYQIRDKDNRGDEYSSGTIILPDGGSQPLGPEDFVIDILDEWRSRETGVEYPIKWKLAIKPLGLELVVTPLIKDQEHTNRLVYWEGAVKVDSDHAGGYGYVELVGYGES
ncbi:MAG: carotenoid 1,2-hydratase [Desulfobacteraceae bacterium]|nr:carotenoid 1,2-hydratase [Desulfobacteraceae bacterium]